jgi:glutamine---fructose-6-phosphate transaminase (isomerizing)
MGWILLQLVLKGVAKCILARDAIALAPFTDSVTYLEDGDWAVLTRGKVEIRDPGGHLVQRAVVKSPASALLIDKGNFRHFMAKEIHEQPEVVLHTLAHYLDADVECIRLPCALPFDFKAHMALAVGPWHSLLQWTRRQILVRAFRAPAGRNRRSVRVPLP